MGAPSWQPSLAASCATEPHCRTSTCLAEALLLGDLCSGRGQAVSCLRWPLLPGWGSDAKVTLLPAHHHHMHVTTSCPVREVSSRSKPGADTATHQWVLTCHAMMPATIPMLQVHREAWSIPHVINATVAHGTDSRNDGARAGRAVSSHDEDGDEQAAHELARLLLDFLQGSITGVSAFTTTCRSPADGNANTLQALRKLQHCTFASTSAVVPACTYSTDRDTCDVAWERCLSIAQATQCVAVEQSQRGRSCQGLQHVTAWKQRCDAGNLPVQQRGKQQPARPHYLHVYEPIITCASMLSSISPCASTSTAMSCSE